LILGIIFTQAASFLSINLLPIISASLFEDAVVRIIIGLNMACIYARSKERKTTPGFILVL
jgi:hypothetical protein